MSAMLDAAHSVLLRSLASVEVIVRRQKRRLRLVHPQHVP